MNIHKTMNAILVTTRQMKMYKNVITKVISHLHISYSCILNVIVINSTDIFKFCINEMCCTSEDQPLSLKLYSRAVFKNEGFDFHHPITDTGNLESTNC